MYRYNIVADGGTILTYIHNIHIINSKFIFSPSILVKGTQRERNSFLSRAHSTVWR